MGRMFVPISHRSDVAAQQRNRRHSRVQQNCHLRRTRSYQPRAVPQITQPCHPAHTARQNNIVCALHLQLRLCQRPVAHQGDLIYPCQRFYPVRKIHKPGLIFRETSHHYALISAIHIQEMHVSNRGLRRRKTQFIFWVSLKKFFYFCCHRIKVGVIPSRRNKFVQFLHVVKCTQ